MKTSLTLLSAGTALFFGAGEIQAERFDIADHDIAALKAAIARSNVNRKDDVINLAPNGTYVLTAPDNELAGLPRIQPDTGHKLTINGRGATISRSTDPNTPDFRFFYIVAGSDVTLDRLVLSNGGGAIFNDHSKLTIRNSTFSGNVATLGGAIFNYGRFGPGASLTIINSSFLDNLAVGTRPKGGAIYNTATDGGFAAVTISGSVIARSTAREGGAIYNNGSGGHAPLRIVNSTFAGNTAHFFGGAIYNLGDFGDAPLRITSSTFSQNSSNSAGGTIYNSGQNSMAPFAIGNTILQSPSDTLYNLFTPVTSLGYNISSDATLGDPWRPFPILNGPGDQLNTDPLLDPAGLKNNGGPTDTIALLPGSPAIDQGKDVDGAGVDQRGFPRPHDFANIAPAAGGDNSDIGAFESHPDTDGDGVPDDSDLCVNSDLRPTVFVLALDSGVPNALLENGCTIADLIAGFAATAKNRGDFTESVEKLTDRLVKQGILSNDQRMIFRKVAKAAFR